MSGGVNPAFLPADGREGLPECGKWKSRRETRSRKWVDGCSRAHYSVQFISMLMTANENQTKNKKRAKQMVMELQFDKQIIYSFFFPQGISPSVRSQAAVSMHSCERTVQLQQHQLSVTSFVQSQSPTAPISGEPLSGLALKCQLVGTPRNILLMLCTRHFLRQQVN